MRFNAQQRSMLLFLKHRIKKYYFALRDAVMRALLPFLIDIPSRRSKYRCNGCGVPKDKSHERYDGTARGYHVPLLIIYFTNL